MGEALVIGGGLAGGAVATLLAQAGKQVTLLERTSGAHDKVCGEFLSAEALQLLQVLGVDAAALGALHLTKFRLTHRRRTVEHTLPFAAMSLTRRVLDEALLARAAASGATVMRGATVESLEREVSGGWVARHGEEACARAGAVFLATGKHDLRGHARPASSGILRQHGLVAFKQYFRLSPEQAASLQSAVEVSLFRGGYCGLQLVPEETAVLALLVRREGLAPWPDLLARVCRETPLLAERLRGAVEVLPRPLALSHLPYGYRRCDTEHGLWALGDQAAVIPSFSGDGMSIALHTGVLAARMFLAGQDAPAFQAQLGRQLRGSVTLATVASRLLVHLPSLATELGRVPGVARTVALRTRVPLERPMALRTGV